jgi:hypothetical protein
MALADYFPDAAEHCGDAQTAGEDGCWLADARRRTSNTEVHKRMVARVA